MTKCKTCHQMAESVRVSMPAYPNEPDSPFVFDVCAACEALYTLPRGATEAAETPNVVAIAARVFNV